MVDCAVSEAEIYRECGVDGVIVENMHDVPYVRGGVGPEVTACMTRVCSEVRLAIGGNIPLGIQILCGKDFRCIVVCLFIIVCAISLTPPSSPSLPPSLFFVPGANKEALAVAQAARADFVRAEGYVFSHVGDEGWIDSCAGELLRYRKAIGAEDVILFTDIKKKHRYRSLLET